MPPSPSGSEGVNPIALRWVAYAWPRALERTFYGAGAPENLASDPLAWPGALTFPPALYAAAWRASRRWDAVISHWALPCAWVAAGLPRARGAGAIPHLAVFHSADVHLLARLPARGAILRRIARGTSRLCFVTAEHRAMVEELAARVHVTLPPCEVQPMGFEPAALGLERPPARPGRTSTSGPLRAVTLGRLVPVKGVDVAIEAVAKTAGRVTLVVAGDGPERDRLERRAARLGAPVRFVGAVRGRDKAALLADADAFVLPSRRLSNGRTEGAPVALLEAMYAGLPVVASRVGGVPELTGAEDAALLVPPDDAGALAAALTRLADTPALARRLAERGHARATRHRWSEVGPRVERWLGVTSGCDGSPSAPST